MQNTDQWRLLSPYLDKALTLSESERADWLESLAKQDPGLAKQLGDLLQAQKAADREEFLLQGPMDGAPSPGLAGQTIGAYRLVSPIGQGGMGTVWLAERSDGRFQRRAAVKFLSHALIGQRGEERFRQEGAILASLTHANIAALWDAGVSTTNQPYLVLEFVEGQPLDRYCDEHKLGIRARIELFLKVLGAVAHAHANLIVHRDLKPSNVFVNSEGEVKLLDFGIAKLLDERPDYASLTQDAGSPLTPAYAAPEQLIGQPITTATDVYALGVLLYEILTGQHPAGANRTPADLIKAIVDTDPLSPSKVLTSTSQEERSLAAANRGVDADKLRKQLSGDLDVILAKALKKDPKERYVSVGALAADLRNYLDEEPISAHRDSFAYRTNKFVKRNLVPVSIFSVALVAVIASLSIGLFVANRERKAAEQRFAQVRQLANKFIDLDNEIRGLPGATGVRKEMTADAQQYLASLGSVGHVNDDLALEIANSYVRVAHVQGDPTSANLGMFPEAEANLNNADKFVDSILSHDPTNRHALIVSAMIEHDRMVLADAQGRDDDSIQHANRAAAQLDRFMTLYKIEAGEAWGVVYFYGNIAEIYQNRRRFPKSILYAKRALEIAQPFPRVLATQGTTYVLLASDLWISGDLEGALQGVDAAILIVQQKAANGHLSLQMNLANALSIKGMILGRRDAEPSLGREQEALAVLQKALDIAEEFAKKDLNDHLSRHHEALFSLEMGNILRHGDPRKALKIYNNALARLSEITSNDSTRLNEAELLAASSYPLRHLGQGAEAKRRIDRAFDLLTQAHILPATKIEPMSAADHAMRALGDHYAETSDNAKAAEMYRQLLDKLAAWQPDPQNVIGDAVCFSRTWSALATIYRRSGKISEAQQYETLRADLWNNWQGKLPNAQFLLRQSLSQATDRK